MKKNIVGICIVLIALVMPLSIGTNIGENNSTDGLSSYTSMLLRISTVDENPLLPRESEVLGGNPGKWIDIILPKEKLQELSALDVKYSVLIEDVDSYVLQFAGQYHTLAQMEQILQNIADTYPDITELYTIGESHQERPIWCLEITDNPGVDEGEPGVFFMGLHHAREWPTLEICLYIADQLTSNYASNPYIQDLVDNRRVWLVACVNPDGYYYSHDQGHDWRKNRHYFPEFGTWGVDNNRNYAGSSNGNPWGAWGSVGHASVTHNPDMETYCGPGPMSEFETQAVRNIFVNNDISASITWHTHGELVLWPWAYSTSDQTPDNTYMAQVGQEIASRITRDSGSGTYTPKQSAYLYPTTGDTADWVYGYTHYVLGRNTFVYTIEACSQFQPPAYKLDQICLENYEGGLYLLEEAENIHNTLTPRVLPPVINEMTQDNDGDYTVSWEQQNPDAQPDYYQLDELSGLTTLTDDAESGSGLWSLDGFSITSSRYHSASHSYKSRETSSDVSSMTTLYPLPITEGMSLSFWCWYDIEENWDYAFVEVSLDGRDYQLLDSYTGSSGGWTSKEYPLDDYIGKSIFIRFRYTTDSYTTYDGFFVDDIDPIADFASVTTLSDEIETTFYDIAGNPEGVYYYRVKGHNSARGWGDFSTLENIEVIPGIPGDANGDGVVNVEDLLIVLAQWGTAGPEGDVNHDGIVNVEDLLMVLANWS